MKKYANLEIRVISSRKQYERYLSVVEELMDEDPAPNSKTGKILETLAILIEAYEATKGWQIPSVNDPVALIKGRMEDLDLRQADLAKVIGDKTKVSRILNGSRKLTTAMILPLSRLLRVPPEVLLDNAA